jgi:hypothetical protein
VIELEDLKTGVSITDLGLNDFRMDSAQLRARTWRADHVPNGMHAVVPADPAMGLQPGVIFTLRNRNDWTSTSTTNNRLHPYYLVYIDRPARWCTTTPRSSACWTWRVPAARAATSRSQTPPSSSIEKRRGPADAGLLRPAGQGHSLHDRGEGREGPGQPVHRRQDHGADQHHLPAWTTSNSSPSW